eukprot:CAMPEP_0113871666 /NCGR_PEP_ID=MMETSP0780_2-20120614/2774_1 /TAXON_ID=652834 /ORGANISM="Palpitomonas bilix" /LENGTH=405 /DNA_ID=CAMNT_0000857091 /DNA_START=61 /DNA_END=1278 /DNA_ORIENTATION=- /assembly_acc=CAM_ASM_000599
MIDYDPNNALKVIFSLRGSSLVRVKFHILATFLMACLVVLLHEFHVIGVKDSQGNFICPRPCSYYNYTLGGWDESTCTINDPPAAFGCGIEINSKIYALLGTAMSLLLVFRSNLSYNRFWEARAHMGNVALYCRNFARHCVFFVDGDDRETDALRKDLIRQIQLFFHVVRLHVRELDEPEWVSKDRHVKYLADAEEVEDLMYRQRRPLVVLGFITKKLNTLLMSKKINQFTYSNMDDCLTQLVSAFNGLDKIVKTPFPFPYAQLIYVLIVLFCYTAPWMLIQMYEWATPFVSIIVTGALFGINAIGLEVEGPFGKDPNDLPVDKMCDAVTADCNMYLSQMIKRGEHDVFGDAGRVRAVQKLDLKAAPSVYDAKSAATAVCATKSSGGSQHEKIEDEWMNDSAKLL